MHLSLAGTLALAVLGVAVGARADDKEEKAACVDAHAEGQKMRRAGKLRPARESFERCARESCPAIVQKDCVTWAEEVADALPSILVVVRDRRGREIAEAEVHIDDQPIALDGRAVELDPGEHRLVVQARGERAERRVLLREGERMRRIEFTVGPKPRKPPPPPGFEPHPVAWVLMAVASVASAGFVTLAVVGKVKESELRGCAPLCVNDAGEPALDEVRTMRQLYLGADISLGISMAAAVALAGYFIVDTQFSATTSGGRGVVFAF
jgi:hypothetical protein